MSSLYPLDIEREVKSTLRQIKKNKKDRQNLKLLFIPRKMKAKLGQFSPALLQHGRRIKQQGGLEVLPNEVFHMVFSLLTNASKVCLALTCKQYAEMFEDMKSVDAKQKRSSYVTPAKRLSVLAGLRDWMSPQKLSLCYSCVKYVPEDGAWRGDMEYARQKVSTPKAIKLGPRCGICAKREWLDSLRARSDVQKLRDAARTL